jgi:hypothetical protein
VDQAKDILNLHDFVKIVKNIPKQHAALCPIVINDFKIFSSFH